MSWLRSEIGIIPPYKSAICVLHHCNSKNLTFDFHHQCLCCARVSSNGAIAFSASITNPMSSRYVSPLRVMDTCAWLLPVPPSTIRILSMRSGVHTSDAAKIRSRYAKELMNWSKSESIPMFQRLKLSKKNRSGVAYQEIYGGGDMHAPQNVPRSQKFPAFLFAKIFGPRTVCIFLMRKGARIPAHDHPGMATWGGTTFCFDRSVWTVDTLWLRTLKQVCMSLGGFCLVACESEAQVPSLFRYQMELRLGYNISHFSSTYHCYIWPI